MSFSSNQFNLDEWRRVQTLFSSIIRANILFFDSSGKNPLPASQVTGYCRDFVQPLNPLKSFGEKECTDAAFEFFNQSQQRHYECLHGVHYLLSEILVGNAQVGVVVVGPVVMGKRKRAEVYRDHCTEIGIDPEAFIDGIYDLRVFSHSSIYTITRFLKETAKHFDKAAVDLDQALVAEKAAPFQDQSGEAARYLLDVASGITRADSGSVLLLDKSGDRFWLRASKRLSPDVKEGLCVTASEECVAGWAARNGKTLVIRGNEAPEGFKAELKRTEIAASILVPIYFREEVLGLLCLNAYSENPKFSSESLSLLDELSRLAGPVMVLS